MNVVQLDEIQVIGLQPLKRNVDLLHCGLCIAAIRLGHEEGLRAIAVAQRFAHAEFTPALVVIPGIIQKRHARIQARADDLDAQFLGHVGLADMCTADAEERDLLSRMAKDAVLHPGGVPRKAELLTQRCDKSRGRSRFDKFAPVHAVL